MREGAFPRQQQDGVVLSLAEPNQALEPTASSFGFAYASSGGLPRAFGCKHFMREKPEAFTPKRTYNLERGAIQGSDHEKDML